MIGCTEVLLVLVLILITQVFISVNRRPSQFPPGPFQLPIFGYIPFISTKAPVKTFRKLAKKYGEAFSLRLGVQNVVYLNSSNLIKEAFNHPDVQGRPHLFTIKFLNFGVMAGIFPLEGDVWLQQRRFTLRHLRDFGFGKLSLESIVLREVDKVKISFKENGGRPFEISNSLNMAIVNIIWKLVADLELDITDPSFLMLMENIDKGTEILGTATILDFLPWLNYIVPESLSGLASLREARDKLYELIQRLIQEHKDSFDKSYLRDFLDVYLKKMEEDKENNVTDSTFTDHQLYAVMSELFIAGSDTSSTTLRFAFLCLISNPEVQRKVQEEILNVTKGERHVSLNDKNDLPYTEGFIMELQRLSNISPMGLPHMTTASVRIRDFVLPKGTLVLANFRYVHLDPQNWPEPEKLDPTRFLDDNGQVTRKIDTFIPFSTGKRQCLGKSLAKAEVFLFVANLLQEFTFTSPPGSTPPSPLDALGGIVVHPKPFELVATPLKQANN